MRSPRHSVTRLFTVAIGSLAIYTLLGVSIGLAWLGVLPLGSALPVLQPLDGEDLVPGPTGTVRTSIRNVFGDPVPGALVHLAGHETHSGPEGDAVLEGIPVGLYEFRVEARGYQQLSIDLRIVEGENEPLIKFDRGLWPSDFAIDFHSFYSDEAGSEQRVFLLVGLANGADEPMYIGGFRIEDSSGLPVPNELETTAAYRRLVLMHSALALATSPDALIVKPHSYAIIELKPVVARPADLGKLRLIVAYAPKDRHLQSDYDILKAIATPTWEPDLNPHRP